MPDIELRFHKDMLVLSAPLDEALARQGVNATRDRQYLNLMEPDVMADAMRFEHAAGAQCLVTATEDITRARLAHVRMEDAADRLAAAAVAVAAEQAPQHILAEIGPCGLPLDPSSKASLNENRAQYADAARAFDGLPIDAFFLNGFTSLSDLRCALMGVYQVSGKPLFASVALGDAPFGGASSPNGALSSDEAVLESISPTALFDGYSLEDAASAPVTPPATPLPAECWPDAVALMQDLGASVVGFETADPAFKAVEYARRAAGATDLPILAQLHVSQPGERARAHALTPLEDILDYTPDTIASAAIKLYGAGVQFLRATGCATPAYTGALAATVFGLDARAR